MTDLALDINIEAGDWPQNVPEIEPLISACLKSALAQVDLSNEVGVEVSLLLTDDAHQQVLNANWRELDKPTNVLSFPSGEDQAQPGQPLMLGDISLAFETVSAEAQEQQKSFTDHVSHLLVHGMLHLLGFDHEVEAQAHEMEALEIDILKTLGIQNPYAERP